MDNDELSIDELISELEELESELEAMFEEYTVPSLLVVSDANGILETEFVDNIDVSFVDVVTSLIPATYSYIEHKYNHYNGVAINVMRQGNRGLLIGAHLN